VTTGRSHEPMDQSLVRFDAFKDFLISAYNFGFLVVLLATGSYTCCPIRNADSFLRLSVRIGLEPLFTEEVVVDELDIFR
jgi:hypothetical protein